MKRGILTRKRQAFHARRSERMAKVGRHLEEEVDGYLEELKSSGKIESFTSNQPFSAADCDGKDFTIRMSIDGAIIEKSFGVTISLRRWGLSKRLHPKTPQFCFPIGTNKETIVRHILSVFDDEKKKDPVCSSQVV
jgi:hypothetical protein